MNQLEEYFKIFGVNSKEVSTIAFDDENRIILITKSDMTRIKYCDLDSNNYSIVRTIMPKELEFMGFQHAIEGNSFMAYGVLNANLSSL